MVVCHPVFGCGAQTVALFLTLLDIGKSIKPLSELSCIFFFWLVDNSISTQNFVLYLLTREISQGVGTSKQQQAAESSYKMIDQNHNLALHFISKLLTEIQLPF